MLKNIQNALKTRHDAQLTELGLHHAAKVLPRFFGGGDPAWPPWSTADAFLAKFTAWRQVPACFAHPAIIMYEKNDVLATGMFFLGLQGLVLSS